MRMPRFRIWTLMVAVTVVAVPIGVCVERRSRFLGIAAWHLSQAAEIERDEFVRGNGSQDWRGWRKVKHGRYLLPKEGLRQLRSFEWHDRLAEIYREAALRPWLPVEPDSPEPE